MLVRDGDWLKADGTTLGADDGVAIAAMMALVEDESLPHGPLELLMTVAEEVGSKVPTRSTPSSSRARSSSTSTARRMAGSRSAAPAARTLGCESTLRGTLPLPTPWRCPSRSPGVRAGTRDPASRSAARMRSRSRACAASGVRDGAVPPRLAERGQEPQRDSARRLRGRLGRATKRGGASRGARARTRPSGTRSRRPMPVSRSRSQQQPRHESRRGRTTRPRDSSTRSPSCRRGLSQ